MKVTFYKKSAHSVWDARNGRLISFVDGKIITDDKHIIDLLNRNNYKSDTKEIIINEDEKEVIRIDDELSRSELMKKCKDKGIKTISKDTKKSLLEKLGA